MQAESLAGKIDFRNYEMIFSSPALRAWQTATILSEKSGLEIIILDNLNFVRFEKEKLEALSAALEASGLNWAKFWMACGHSGLETPLEYLQRLKAALCGVYGRNYDSVLAVAHGETVLAMRMLIGMAIGEAFSIVPEYARLYEFQIEENMLK